MDLIPVSASVINSLGYSTTKHTAQLHWKNTDIQSVKDWTRHFGVKQAVKKHAEIPDEDQFLSYLTMNNWLQHCKKTGEYFEPCGHKRILSTDEVEQVQDAAIKLRKAPHTEGLTSSSVAAIARGVVAGTRPAVLHKNGGMHRMVATWA